MGKTSFMQTSFLGGEWGSTVQGRMDSEHYKIALNRCLNYYPVEEGSLFRRQGTRFLAQTRRGKPGRLLGFDFSTIAPYQCEFTDSFMRIFRGTQLVEDSEVGFLSISTATPAEVTSNGNLPAGWATGDTVDFVIDKFTSVAPGLYNRRFVITKTAADKFTIADEATGFDVDGNTIGYVRSFSDTDDVVRKIVEFATQYTSAAKWGALRLVQDETTAVLLTRTVKPYYINETTPGSVVFQLTAVDFLDGPYLDPNTTTTTITSSGTSGSVTLTASSATGINDGTGFQTTDVGRLVRLFSSPAAWAIGTTYAVAATILATDGNVYTSLKAGNVGHDPTKDVTNWALSPTGSIWTWAQITARASTTSVTATIRGDALLNTNAMPTWRLGVFSDTTGWPTCGCYHEERLCLSGAVGNRIDCSKSNDRFNFAPTAPDGTVADNNAVASIAKATEVNVFVWLLSEEDGLYAGAIAGEWRLRASNLDDPITPTSQQMRRVTTYGSFDSEALCTPRSILFIQRKQRKVFEFATYKGETNPDANNLTLTGPQATVSGLEEIVWQQEPSPIMWARRTDGKLVGCSYRRTTDQFYSAWHRHELGTDRDVTSLSVGPTYNGLSESLYMVTVDPTVGQYWVEMMTGIFDDDADDWECWFTDSAPVPGSALLIGSSVRYYGLWHLIGGTVQAFVAGLDLGDYVVQDGGYIDVPLGSAGGLFTEAYLANYVSFGTNYGEFGVPQKFVSATPGSAGISNSIRAYVGADGHVTGVTGTACFPDDDNGFLYEFKNGTGATSGLRKFLSEGTSAEVLNANKADLGLIGASRGIQDNTGGSAVMDASGHMYLTTIFSNTSELGKFDTDLSSIDGYLGVASSAVPPGNGPFGVYSMASARDIFGNTYLLSSCTISQFPLTLMSADPVFTLCGGSSSLLNPITASRAVICGGLPKNDHTMFYVMDKPLYGAPATTAWRLHKVRIDNGANRGNPNEVTASSLVTYTFIKSIAPTDIDATWTNFSNGKGMAFDQTDGNVILQFATTDAVATQTYLVKISTFDGSVLWKTALGAVDAYGDANMNKHRIVNSRLLYLNGTTLSIFNTTDGSVTTQSYGGVTLTGGQISDDKYDGTLTFFGSYLHNGQTATLLGSYMIANLDATNAWLRIYANIQPDITAINVYRSPALFGLGYTSQAQLLRPDYGQDAGAQAGPAFGKLRRADQYAISTYRTRQVDIGTEFGKLRPVNFRFEGGTDIPMPTLLTGIWAGGLEGRNDFDQKIAWQQNRPFPGVFLAVAGFLETKDH
jgi:hypothetical protein